MGYFENLGGEKLSKVFLTLQKVMETIIMNDGNNDFKLPHMGKANMDKAGMLTTTNIILSSELNLKKR